MALDSDGESLERSQGTETIPAGGDVALVLGDGHCACFPLSQIGMVAGSEAIVAIREVALTLSNRYRACFPLGQPGVVADPEAIAAMCSAAATALISALVSEAGSQLAHPPAQAERFWRLSGD